MDLQHPPFMDGKSEEHETRQRILLAARQLMAQAGFKSATTRKIAEAAGVNEVTLFRHFGSKENILATLVEEMASVRPALEESLESEFENLEEMLMHYGRTFFNVMLERKELLMICMIEAQSRPDLDTQFRSQVLQSWCKSWKS